MTRTYIIHPVIKSKLQNRGSADCLLEIVDLSEAIHLNVIQAEVINIQKISPATFLGHGTVERLKNSIENRKIDLIIVDTALSPIQQRNLETAWQVKVIDRTGLILEIFGARAKTNEGFLQVEHAALTYQKSRLVRSWTHLERQRGGFGFLGGPGESQLELDKRMLNVQIKRIEKKLDGVKKTRALHRKNRKRSNYPVIALVGYTNSGKSTIFNQLTNANVLVKDMLFATLDPTMRAVNLPSNRKIIVSDTVGFISDLPHELVDAFHATLEEVINADILLQVHDISNPEYKYQAEQVEKVLNHIFNATSMRVARLHIWNKKDLLSENDQIVFQNKVARSNDKILISAINNKEIRQLVNRIELLLRKDEILFHVTLPSDETHKISWLYKHGNVEVINEKIEGIIEIKARLNLRYVEQFEKL